MRSPNWRVEEVMLCNFGKAHAKASSVVRKEFGK